MRSKFWNLSLNNLLAGLMNIKDFFPETLTDDQIGTVSSLESFLQSEINCFLLKGYAGTGKTFLMQGLVNYFKAIGRSFSLMAPTGRAAMIIGYKTKNEAFTIHKRIYYTGALIDDEHTFKFKYGLNNNQDSVDTVYIVDESSMISDHFNEDEFFIFGSGYLLKDLFSYVNFPYRPNAKIIFVGDNAQLPPVGMSFSPALDKQYLKKNYNCDAQDFEMKEVVRQKNESGILACAKELRIGLEENVFNKFSILPSKGVQLCPADTFESSYFECTKNQVSEDTVVITHSNKQAHDYNTLIRSRFFPNQFDIQPNDLLINTKNNYNYAIELYNGQFMKVVEAAPSPEAPRTIRFYKKGGEIAEVTFDFREVLVSVVSVSGVQQLVNCLIIDNFLNSNFARLTQNEQQALYVDFKNRNPNLKPGSPEFITAIKNDKYFNALQVKYGYAITCHKAQGGEWMNAFVDLHVYMRTLSKGFFRWAYTGVTRAKECLFAVNVQNYSPITEYILFPVNKTTNTYPDQYYIPGHLYNREVDRTFSAPVQKVKYIEITEKLQGQDIQIDIQHLQWVERYTFSRDGKEVTMDFNYGANGFTGGNRVIRSNDDEFSQMIAKKVNEALLFKLDYHPPTKYQAELYEYLLEETEEANTPITNIVNGSWFDRFYLQTDGKFAFLDCWYDKSGIYTALKPSSSLGSEDHKLLNLIQRLS